MDSFDVDTNQTASRESRVNSMNTDFNTVLPIAAKILLFSSILFWCALLALLIWFCA